ncbi:hypothetical protein GEMRC1_011019 [Eukaryota sp. GEM-RC1]
MSAPSIPQLNLNQAKEACGLVRESFSQNKDRILKAKTDAGSDFALFLSNVVPIIIEVQGQNLIKFGFPPTQMGIMQFMGAIAPFMHDPEVNSVVTEIRSSIMPSS